MGIPRISRQVDQDVEDPLDVDWQDAELVDPDNDQMMSSLVDVLQTLGVSVGDATAYALNVVKDRIPISAIHNGASYNPTFFEIYGQGNLVKAAHGCRRNLNLQGLHALDLRTSKPNGEAWNFSRSSDRQMAKSMVETLKPTWVVGSPPCTFFSTWNQGLNHKHMDPERVERLREEAIRHLHFVVSIYRMQLDAGRHFLHEYPATATSWSDPWVMRVLKHPCILYSVSSM